MAITLAYALAPLRDVFEPAAYDRFIERWTEKSLTERELQAIINVFNEHAYTFKRAQLIVGLERAQYAYSVFTQAHTNLSLVQDTALARILKLGIGNNPWLAAVSYSFHEHFPEVNTRTESGKMTFKLFMAVLSVLKTESSGAGAKKVPRDHDDESGHDEVFLNERDEKSVQEDNDLSSMSIEEQIEKFNLHRDTYL